jgi:peptidoglycan/LPS O-acetylase OafA/YrhL
MLPGTLFTFMVGYSLNFLPELPDRASVKSGLLVSGILFLALLQWQLSLNDVYWTGHWILIIWPPCVALTIAMIVYFVEQPALSSKWLEYPIMIWLGNISFGVYLWHYPIMRSMALLTPETWSAPEASLAALPVALLATLSIATLSYRWIERPLMNWGRSPS